MKDIIKYYRSRLKRLKITDEIIREVPVEDKAAFKKRFIRDAKRVLDTFKDEDIQPPANT